MQECSDCKFSLNTNGIMVSVEYLRHCILETQRNCGLDMDASVKALQTLEATSLEGYSDPRV